MQNAFVVKVGGALLDKANAATQFFQQLSSLKDSNTVVVHGGGAQVAQLLAQLSLESPKINGLRVTPSEHMPYVTGCLAGTVNKTLVASALAEGLPAIGLSILDGRMITAKVHSQALGAVGTPVSSDSALLTQLLQNNWLPVVASIGADENGNLLNINADHAAAAIAESLGCSLVLLSDVPAVLDEKKQRIASITPKLLTELVEKQVVTDGMLVKVNAAMDTAKQTGQTVIIAGWQDDIHAILNGDAGTQIHYT